MTAGRRLHMQGWGEEQGVGCSCGDLCRRSIQQGLSGWVYNRPQTSKVRINEHTGGLMMSPHRRGRPGGPCRALEEGAPTGSELHSETGRKGQA